jgi:hypothetical protein
VTQVIPADELATELETCQAAMRNDIVTSAIPPPAIDNYGGLSLSQNALNYYVYSQWIQGVFNLDITDSRSIVKLIALLPAGTVTPTITRIHVWPAASPRAEIAEQALVARQRPLVLTFDDLRICFEMSGPWVNDMPGPSLSVCELSANARAEATVTLDWPLIPTLRFDLASVGLVDASVWELTDPNQPPGTASPTAPWAPFVRTIVAMLLAPNAANTINAPPMPSPWRNPIPRGMPQELIASVPTPPLFPQSLYMDVLGQRRALHLLPVLQTILLELVNGSGAPTLNLFLGTTGVTMMSMTCLQGTSLRKLIVAASLQSFVFPGP